MSLLFLYVLGTGCACGDNEGFGNTVFSLIPCHVRVRPGVLQVRDHSQAILCLSRTANADRLLTASKDNQLRLWDFRQLGTVQVRARDMGLS